ncbi:MAG: SDR family NAD(P)-dependent oxidoreductase [Pirellulaceae bacterium]
MTRRTLSGLRVLITGASSGIGRALALELANRGAILILTARRETLLESLCDEIRSGGGKCDWFASDVTDGKARTELLEFVRTKWDALDALVNCAGVGAMGAFADADSQRLRQIFEVNFFSAAELTRESLPLLKKGQTPVVVNVGSVLGHCAVPLKSEYCASKFAIHGFSDAIRGEFKDLGIDVLLVSPSTTDSEFFDAALEDQVKKDWKGKNAMPPSRVATIIARAMRLGKREVIISWGGKFLVWFDRLMPGVMDNVLTRFAK